MPVEMHPACGFGHNVVFQCKTKKPNRALATELEERTALFMYKVLGNKLTKGSRDYFFDCSACYCAECNNPAFGFDLVECRTRCSNPCAGKSDKNPYTPGNPCKLPYPCTQ